jgi:hypothetical protein
MHFALATFLVRPVPVSGQATPAVPNNASQVPRAFADAALTDASL